MNAARSAGGMPVRYGCKPHTDRAITREEARDFNANLSAALHVSTNPRKCRHFSHFDGVVEASSNLSHEEATRKLVVLLGECAAVNFRGVRPQLASLLVILAKLARRDGYSLRVVAESALNSISHE